MKKTFLIISLLFISFNATSQTTKAETYEYLELFGEVLDTVKRNYVDEVTDKELLEAAIQGMLQSLDPHSGYLDERNLRILQDSTRGEFGGLGIQVNLDDSGYVLVISPIDDTPAAEAGLQSGDLITGIDGKDVLGMTLDEAVQLMRGKPDTDITLDILRGDDESFEVTITRAIITLRPVRWEMKADDIGYIRISDFSEKTNKKLKDAVKELQRQGKISGYILDLRNNPGGLLNQAVEVSDSFLDKGEIVSILGRDGDDNRRYQAKRGDIIDGAPLLVLINEGSASASEIVAGALRDHRRALVVGSKSFGKGSVQTIIPLEGGSGEVAMRLTTQRYYTPSGESIQAKGIEPDIEIVPSKVTPIERGKLRSEADLPKALDSENNENSEKAEDSKEQDDDYVLSRAVEILKAVELYR